MRSPKKYVAANGDESWRVRYRSASGAQKSETFYNEPDAEEFCKLLDMWGPAKALAYLDQREAEQGDGRAPALTVHDLFTRWHEWKSKTRKDGTPLRVRSVRTLLDYDRMYRSHIRGSFGSRPANLVSGTDVQVWIDELSGELSAKTVADYHSLLHAMYAWGIHPTRGLVVSNPCLETQLPKRQKKPAKGLRPAEWHILHRAARNVDQDAADLLLFLASTGWRWSEAVAVQSMAVDHWEDDPEVGGASHTYVTMGRVMRREGNVFVFVEDEAKSDAGRRRVRVRGAAEEMVLRRIVGKKPTDLILTNPKGNPWRYSSFYQRYWKRRGDEKKRDEAPKRGRILEEAKRLGLDRPDLTPHWLRHTHVGMLILAGEPLTAIQRRLGHASIKTTSDTYGRMIEDASPEGLDRVAAMLDGNVPPEVQELTEKG